MSDDYWSAQEVASGAPIPDGAIITSAILIVEYMPPDGDVPVTMHIVDSDNRVATHIGNLMISLNDLIKITQEED